jgi:predicted small lipoprotein YifL
MRDHGRQLRNQWAVGVAGWIVALGCPLSTLWIGRPGGRNGKALTALALTCALSGCGAKIPQQQPPVNPAAIAAAAAAGCKDDLSEKAAQLAREKYPDSLAWPTPGGWPTSELWAARTRFLRENTWTIFDVNHDRRLDFEEYHALQWANFLAAVPAGQCIVRRDYYFFTALGRPGEPLNGWNRPLSEELMSNNYNFMDRDDKGFITKDDTRILDQAAFGRADRLHQGYLTWGQPF